MKPVIHPGAIFLIFAVLLIAVLLPLVPRHRVLFSLAPSGCMISSVMIDIVRLDTVTLDVDFDGGLVWDGAPVAGPAALNALLASLASRPVPATLHIRMDKWARYGALTAIIEQARQRGVRDIAIVNVADF